VTFIVTIGLNKMFENYVEIKITLAMFCYFACVLNILLHIFFLQSGKQPETTLTTKHSSMFQFMDALYLYKIGFLWYIQGINEISVVELDVNERFNFMCDVVSTL
jgi:hypothetical protein